jgi:methyl-accepting chemotaxis protein
MSATVPRSFADYDAQLAHSGDRLLLGVVTGLLVMSFALAPWHGTWTEVFLIGVPAAAMSAFLTWARPGSLLTRNAIAASLMVFAGLEIHQAHGMAELHFSVFVLLAFLLVYRDWRPIITAAAVIAVHHLSLDYVQRDGGSVWVFATRGGFGIVLLHAAYVVFETAILVALAIRLRAESMAVGSDPRALSVVAQRLALGKLDSSARGDDSESEAPSLSESIAAAQRTIGDVVAESGEVLRAIARGDLSRRVHANAPGDFAMLKDNVNVTAQFLSRFTEMQADLVRRANAGDFAGRVDTAGFTGYQLDLATGLNSLVGQFALFIDELATVVGALAHGDLTERVDAKFHGRLDELTRDTNTTVLKLTEVVDQIQLTADLVSAGARELACGNEDLRVRTEEQAAGLQTTASSMDEMNSTVRHTAENAVQASQLAAAARGLAQQGGDVVGRAVGAMQAISASSRKITDIIGVINDIAFQTNLLALNAAVEAARAGDQGRGFAVVASEVRSLAGRSAEAAREIKALIQDSVSKVDDGARLVNESGRTLGEIVASVKQVTDLIAEISAASNEQAAGVDGVHRAISGMEDTTRRNADLVDKTAAATESLRGHAGTLNDLLGFFRLETSRDLNRAAPRISRAG